MITVIGLGFVGLTTALGFCSKGFTVYGFDIDQKKINQLRKGKIPFHEPHLKDALTSNLNRNFFLTRDLKEALKKSSAIFYCVGTPEAPNGDANLEYLLAAIRETLKKIPQNDFKVLVVKSTVPPLTTQNRIKPLLERSGFILGKTIGLANNPEFLREGRAWEDFVHPDRIVIGCSEPQSENLLKNLYRPFKAPIFKVSLNTAEYIKYLSNTFLATLISLANEMSLIAHSIGDIDIEAAFKIFHRDKRWSGEPANMSSYVYPGCGFGGMCLPKDLKCFYTQTKKWGCDSGLLKEVLEVNSKIKKFVVKKVTEVADKKETIGIFGLAFKPNTDDVRESPAKDIIKLLLDRGYRNLVAYDPIAISNFKKSTRLRAQYHPSIKEAIKKSDVILILTAWNHIREQKELLQNKKVLDFRYFLKNS